MSNVKLSKIKAVDQNGKVLYESPMPPPSADPVGTSWATAILWDDDLEEALGQALEGADDITTITITAERVQTDAAPSDPIKSDPDDDEEEDEEEDRQPGSASMTRPF